MAALQSLDELLARKAAEFADQVKKAAALADKEEEIRIEVEKQLAFIQREAGIELHGKHEFTVAKGRVDSVYSRVLIEYKNPSDPSARIGQKGKPFSPEYLAGDFGANETSIAISGVHALYEAIVTTDHPKARTFFNQWKILFGEVCGYEVDNPSDKVKKLAESYGIAARGLK